MVNKPKKIGTNAESAVVKKLLPYYPEAKRLALAGAEDRGDIDAGDDTVVMFEVKGGKQCAQIGDTKLAQWMAETDRERDNSGKRFGFLVTQRPGVGLPNADRWWVWVHLGDLAEIAGGYYRPGAFAVARLELRDLLELLADNELTPDKSQPVTAMTQPIHIIETADAVLEGDLFKPAAAWVQREVQRELEHLELLAAYQQYAGGPLPISSVELEIPDPLDIDMLTEPSPRPDDWN